MFSKHYIVLKFRYFLLLMLLLVGFVQSQAQLNYTVNGNATQLVQNILGPGLTFSNATLNCGGNASGTFTYVPDASLSYTGGVILATGKLAGGIFSAPINAGATNQMSDGVTPSNNDAVLNTLASDPTRADCCVLDFDFIPLGDTIKFNYVFGSEEYPEYACSAFNDVFGFFVSGPNPSGGNYTNMNIALIPGTTFPVAINMVNSGSVGANGSASNCTPPDGSLAYSSYYYNNSSSTRIVFDGLTKNMLATIPVTPCSTYHMKLGVEDVGDNAYDSGVFLKAGSLSSNFTQITSGVNNSPSGDASEGCDSGYVQFKINVRTTPTVIRYQIGGTATNGVDYVQIPDSVTIPIGDTIARMSIVTIPDALTEGTETIKIYLIGQCSPVPIDSTTIKVFDKLRLTLPTDTTICRDSSIILNPTTSGGSGIYRYLWTPPATLSSATVRTPRATPIDTTSYILTLTDSTGCSVKDTIKVNIRDCNTLTLSVDKDTVCPGEQVFLNASVFRAGFSQWTPASGSNAVSNATIQNPTAIVNSNQTYVYSVTRQDGSVLKDSVTVYIDTTAHVSLGPDIIQCDTTITLTASATGNQHSPYRFYWFSESGFITVETTGTITVSQPVGTTRTYWVRLTGTFCEVEDTILVTAGDLSRVIVKTDVSCNGANDGQITVTPDGTAPYTYTWSANAATGNVNTASGLASNIYTVSISDAIGCSVMDTVVITEPAPLAIPNPTTTNVTCGGGSNGTINSLATGGTVGYTYTWNPIQANSGTLSGLSANTYLLTVTDANGCSITATYIINEPTPLLFNAPTQTEVLCYGGNTGSISSSATGGTGAISYAWFYNQNAYTPNSPTNAANLSAGQYTQIATDANGCKDTAFFNVGQPSALVLANLQITHVDCNGNANGRIISTASGGTPVYTYSWNHAAALNSDTASGLSGNTYTQTVTDANGCTTSASYTVLEPAVLTLALDSFSESCFGRNDGGITSFFSGGSPAYQFELSRSGTVIQTNSNGRFSPLAAGNYSVQLTDGNGCFVTEITDVPGKEPESFVAVADTTSCFGTEYQDGVITVSPQGTARPYQFSIDSGRVFTFDTIFNNLGTGIYTIIAKNASGCDTSFTVVVPQPLPAVAVINPNDSTIQIGEQIVLNASIYPYSQSSIVSYHWTPSSGLSCDDCPNPTVTSYERENEYQLTIVYNDICEATTRATVWVTGEGLLYIPNAFSPNGDGVNDVFEIYGKQLKTSKLKVFNRWGEKVYDSMDNPFGQWNGRFKGILQPPMIYIYEAEIEFLNGKTKRQMGSLTLIR